MSVTGNWTTSKVSIAPPEEPRRGAEPSPRLREKVPDGRCDLVAVRLEGEVSRLEERDLRVLDVALESLRACGHEERVSIAPDGQQRRLVPAKVILEPWIHLDIARVVEEQVQLDLVRAGSGHVVIVQVVAVRRNQGDVLDAGSVLPVGRLGLEQ